MVACTIIARNYLAQARILARSFAEQVPDGRMVVLVLDPDAAPTPLADEAFEILTPADIMDPGEFGQMATIYTVVELATAVKPWLLEHLLGQAPAVSYFDPDIRFFSDPVFIDDLAREHGVVMTPHATEPLPRGAVRTPGEDVILSAGIYNLGCVAVGGERGLALARWWQSRLRRECIIDPAVGRFVDQRWMDLAPGYFAPYILRNPGCNTAWWNLPTRDVREHDEHWTVNGEDLVFFHFSGYDPRRPHLVSKHQGPFPRVLLSEIPDLARIFAAYGQAMLDEGHAESSAIPYGLNTIDGLTLDPIMRSLFRTALINAEESGDEPPANPFTNGVSAFVAWLSEPAPGLADTRAPGRYLMTVWSETPGLRDQFPQVPGAQTDAFERHVGNALVPDGVVPELLAPNGAPPARMPTAPVEHLQPGVNVIAYFTAESGVGQAARLMLSGIEAAGIPHATVTYDNAPGRRSHAFTATGVEDARFDTNLICVNADQILTANHWMGDRLRANRYRIGLWWWETAVFPDTFDGSFDVVDEIWVGSAFVGDAIRQRTDKPVTVIPMPVVVPEAVGGARATVDISDDTFLVLFAYDFDSVFARKNPLGALEAYRRAFTPDSGCTLLLKSINGERHLEQLEELRMAAADRPDVIVLDHYLDATTNRGLIAECDCYLSLHRSEGFGVTIAEAMAYGRPVVASAYSANMEFMDAETGYPVPVTEGIIPKGAEPYPAGTTWAEPDIDEAARLLAHVRGNPAAAARIGTLAANRIRTTRSPGRAGTVMADRLSAIRAAGGQARAVVPVDPDPLSRTEELGRRLNMGGLTPWNTGGRAPRSLAQRGLLRTLRPYLTRRGEIDSVMLQGIAELDTRCTNLEAQQGRNTDNIRGLRQHVGRLDERMSDEAGARGRLGEMVTDLGEAVTRLDWELSTPMYMRDPDEFRLPAQAGGGLGYVDAPGDASEDDLYLGFEDVFRGPVDIIREMQRPYVSAFPAGAPVADIGCGRGEFLDLLAEAGLTGIGVDSDAGMIAAAHGRGHASAILADGIEWLEAQAPGSLGGVFAGQVIEHMSYDDLLRFLSAAQRALRPEDGVVVAETVNPRFIPAFRGIWVDLTHQLVIYPEVALALTRLTGFRSARIAFPGGSGDAEADRRSIGQFAVVASVGPQAPPVV